MILDQIIETKKEEVAGLYRQTSIARLRDAITGLPPCRNFRAPQAAKPVPLSPKSSAHRRRAAGWLKISIPCPLRKPTKIMARRQFRCLPTKNISADTRII